MKKLILLLLFIPLVFFGQEKLSKKEIKNNLKIKEHIEYINKYRIVKIINNGLDLNAQFVAYGTNETEFSRLLLKNGFNVGDYFTRNNVKDTQNREMLVSTEVRYNGRYIFTLAESRVGKKGFGGYSFITIKDLENNNKIVASIMIDLRKVDYRKTKKMPREYMLIEDDLNDKLWSEIFSELRALNNK